MQPSISKIFKILAQYILRLTLYDMIQSSHDFEDVRTALNDRTDWSIELVSPLAYLILHYLKSFYSSGAASRRRLLLS